LQGALLFDVNMLEWITRNCWQK